MIVLGPALAGRLPFVAKYWKPTTRQGGILNFVYWLGVYGLGLPLLTPIGAAEVPAADVPAKESRPLHDPWGAYCFASTPS